MHSGKAVRAVKTNLFADRVVATSDDSVEKQWQDGWLYRASGLYANRGSRPTTPSRSRWSSAARFRMAGSTQPFHRKGTLDCPHKPIQSRSNLTPLRASHQTP